jgi:H+/Cl- antiporter ClcA
MKRTGVLAQWTLLGVTVGALCGVASAIFLVLLERATQFREAHEVIVYTLPLAGAIIGLVYERWGTSIEGGNNLIIDTIHDDTPQVPLRMAPMILVGTVLTHLFGGSAGREGAAVQMGASLADEIAHRFRVPRETRRQLLSAGIAGGFGSVFGTPIAGIVFGLEVTTIGRIEYDALVPAMLASIVGDFVTRQLGVRHTIYPELAQIDFSLAVFGKLCIVGIAMAGATVAFVECTHRLKRRLSKAVPRLPIRMFLGGLVVVGMWKLVGTSDYLGLGVPTILRSFSDPTLPTFAFAAKLVFTVVTLSAGFLGGEVTPLFFIGATLGSVLGRVLGLPIELGAGVGLAAVFAAGANTPLALSIMAVELCGRAAFPHVFIVAVIAYLLSGHRGIYPAQRLVRRKHGGAPFDRPVPLREYDQVSETSDID